MEYAIHLMDRTFYLLRLLGMRSTYAGYNYLAYAIYLTLENQDYLRKVTKNLYVLVGDKYGVSNRCVEAALRTLINSYWNQNKDRILKRFLGYPIFDKPTASEFVSILSDYLRDHPNFGVERDQ